MKKILLIIFFTINLQVIPQDTSDNNFYSGSYALLIGISDYKNSWPKLPGVKQDIELISSELEKQGYQTIKLLDPTGQEMEKSIIEFINNYGHDINNRLLIYFAGHGFTILTAYGEDMGYIVPIDAPNPIKNKIGFIYKAVSMERFELFAKQIESKHALFIFDACFAGSIFSLSRGDIPTNIQYKLSLPVRQFITSGSANETVPDISIFRQQFILGIEGEADINLDGYITGTEMGEFLQEKVINYSKGNQHPQFGKIRNPRLDKGDFILNYPSTKENQKNIEENTEKREYNKNKNIVVQPLNFLNNEYLNFAPSVSPDGKTIYFVSDRPGSVINRGGKPSKDIWAVTKKNILDTIFSDPYNVKSINSTEDEGPMSITLDQTIYYSSLSNRPDDLGGDADIYYAKMNNNEFTKPLNVGPSINSKYWDSNPSISMDQKRLYFASNRPGPNGNNNCDIWYSDWNEEKNEWMPAINLTEINTTGKEFAPYIGSDGLTLFFSSDKHKPNYGGLDFYITRYDVTTGKWSKPQNLGNQVNTADDEMYISIPASGNVLYISSKRTDVQGIESRLNIYMIYMKDLK